ncbi:MAG: flagellar hook-length control protein FliK [Phycisphaeraceae bacterium]|nr:flagellar hook-length control protein FliK [Phycisphaeraceae bacterium]MBX3366776.1 flagellar hook-length control protein FliK [Phycisphaeraceae bacterium]QYK46857.1 MAG: flagellar hook-length control protein FliK [Phycisphaeraceae bacterium]
MESVRPAGTETGGGAAESRKRGADSGDTPSFDDAMSRAEGIYVTLDGRLDVAALMALDRPIDQQQAAIDHKRATIEGSRREEPSEQLTVVNDGGRRTSGRVVTASHQKPAEIPVPPPADRSGQNGFGIEIPAGEPREDPRAMPVSSERLGTTQPAKHDQLASPLHAQVPIGGEVIRSGAALGASRGEVAVGGVGSVQPVSSTGGQMGAGTNGESALSDHGGRAALARLVGIGARHEQAAQTDRPASALRFEQETQVSAQFKRGLAQVLKAGGGEITMRLNPEQLGALRIQVRVGSGVIGVRVQAETEQARELLIRDSATLRAALESRGLDVEYLTIDKPARSAGQIDGQTSETPPHEDRGAGDMREDRSHGGDRQSQDAGAQGRARWSWRGAPESLPDGAAGAIDPRLAYGGRWLEPHAALAEVAGVIRLDATG